jgi:hypothetical protein
VTGILLLSTGERFGWVFIFLGAASLAWRWHIGYVPPVDPLLDADVDKAMDLEKSDPATANKLLDRAVDDADRRGAQRRADLLRRAKTDRRAAVELRNRLRYELKLSPAIRRKAEEYTITASARTEALKQIDRQAADTQTQLIEVEQLLGDYPFYMEWLDQATELLRTPVPIKSGGMMGEGTLLLLFVLIGILIALVARRLVF